MGTNDRGITGNPQFGWGIRVPQEDIPSHATEHDRAKEDEQAIKGEAIMPTQGKEEEIQPRRIQLTWAIRLAWIVIGLLAGLAFTFMGYGVGRLDGIATERDRIMNDTTITITLKDTCNNVPQGN